MEVKRFQECNRIEKIYRYRHYLKIPFRWLRWRIHTWIIKGDKDFNGITYWGILIGIAQSEMRWYYTEDELDAIIKKHF